jgi:hypothetical protein
MAQPPAQQPPQLPHPTIQILVTPMPTPGTPYAPLFKGERVKDFLDSLEVHADSARIDRNDLPGYVLRYCNRHVRNTIESASHWAANDWAATRQYLIKLYGSNDRKPLITVDKFRKWIKRHSSTKTFSRVQDVDRYYREFEARAVPLIADNHISVNEADVLFFKGIPKSKRKIIRRKLPAAQTKVNSPPPRANVLALLQGEFDEDDIDNDSDSDTSEDSDSSDDSGSDSDEEDTSSKRNSRKKKKKGKFNMKKVPATPPADSLTPSSIEMLAKQMQDLQLAQATILRELAANKASGTQTTTSNFTNERRCFICDEAGVHRLGIRNCPEVRTLIEEGLVAYAPDGRLMRADGNALPRGVTGGGGVAKVLRDEKKTSSSLKGKGREDQGQSSRMAASVGLETNGEDLLDEDVYGVSSFPARRDSFAVTRSQAKSEQKKGNVFERKTDQEPKTVPNPRRQSPSSTQPLPTSSQPTQVDKSPPFPRPPIVNTREGWDQRKTTNKDKAPVQAPEQRDVNKRSTPGFHFTSTIQEMIDSDVIQQKILDTLITLPLKEILGVSPELQKRFSGLTKTRREYTSKPVIAASADDCQGPSPSISNVVLSDSSVDVFAHSELLLSYHETEDVEDILIRYSSAIKIHTNPLFAMTTGRFEGTLAGHRVLFMVDTGSELNLISSELFHQTSLALDVDGARWSLKGINGGAVPLVGCCRDVSVLCGGHRFDHHFFVNRESTGKQDVILGQPWLQWYSATLAYSRTGTVEMCLWKDGDRDQCDHHQHRPTISIRLVAPNAPRNADKLTLSGHRATIEEVSDLEN